MSRRRPKLAGITDNVDALRAARDRLAAEIDAADNPWLLAQLMPQFTATVRLLSQVAPQQQRSAVDEIFERRNRRLAEARAAGSGDG